MTVTAQRRQSVRNALIAAAERAVAERGLAGFKARELAAEADCAVGAIYNVFEDLDELVMVVNARTLADLERVLIAGQPTGPLDSEDAAIDRLVCLGTSYLQFVVSNLPRWRALFDHRLPPGRDVPRWLLEEQVRLFGFIEEPLGLLQPQATARRRALLARSMFSAAHGVITLGVEEKLGELPHPVLREQVVFIVTALGRGLLRS